jgi:hypothetical protein
VEKIAQVRASQPVAPQGTMPDASQEGIPEAAQPQPQPQPAAPDSAR